MRKTLVGLAVLGMSLGSVSAAFAEQGANIGSAGMQMAQYYPDYDRDRYRERERERERIRREEDRDRDHGCTTQMVKNNGVWHPVRRCY